MSRLMNTAERHQLENRIALKLLSGEEIQVPFSIFPLELETWEADPEGRRRKLQEQRCRQIIYRAACLHGFTARTTVAYDATYGPVERATMKGEDR